MTTQITVIGLDQIGISIGLALAEYKDRILRCGHDSDLRKMKNSEKVGAFDKTFSRLPDSVQDAEVVLLALPVDLIKDTLTKISKELKPGTVVINTSLIRIGISEWARQILPKEIHFISMMPVLNPQYLEERIDDLRSGHADLFEKSELVIASEFDTNSKALKTAVDIAELLKARTLFTDPLEADGLISEVEQLPRVTASALMHTLVDRPGWKDGRRFTSKAFFRAASITELSEEEEFFGISLLMNKENVTRSIGELMVSLQELRELIAENDEDGLRNYLRDAKTGFSTWLEQRRSTDWDTVKQEDTSFSRNIGQRLFGGKFKSKPKN